MKRLRAPVMPLSLVALFACEGEQRVMDSDGDEEGHSRSSETPTAEGSDLKQAPPIPASGHADPLLLRPTESCLSLPDPDRCCSSAQRVEEGTEGPDSLFFIKAKEPLCVFGKEDDDWIRAGVYDDFVAGGPGHNAARLWGGDDVYVGSHEQDLVLADWGDDYVLGSAGSDAIWGGFGNDTIEGGAGADVLWGGFGDDKFVIRDLCEVEPGDFIHGQHGNDTLVSPVDRKTLAGLGVVALSIENFVVSPPDGTSECTACSCEKNGGSVSCCGSGGTCDPATQADEFRSVCVCPPGLIGTECATPLDTPFTPASYSCLPNDPVCTGVDPTEPVVATQTVFTESDVLDVCPDLAPSMGAIASFPEDTTAVYCPGSAGCVPGAGPYPLVVWAHATGGTYDQYGYLQEYLAQSGIVSASIELGSEESLAKGAAILCYHRLLRDRSSIRDNLSSRYMFGGHSSGGAGSVFASVARNTTGVPTDTDFFYRGTAAVANSPVPTQLGAGNFGGVTAADSPSVLSLAASFDSDVSTFDAHDLLDRTGLDIADSSSPGPVEAGLFVTEFPVVGFGQPPTTGSSQNSHYFWGGLDFGVPGGGIEPGQVLSRLYVGGFFRWWLLDDTFFRPYFTQDLFTPGVSDYFGPDRPRVYQRFTEGDRSVTSRRLTVDSFSNLSLTNDLGLPVDTVGFETVSTGFSDSTLAYPTSWASEAVFLEWSPPTAGEPTSATFTENLSAPGGSLDLSDFKTFSVRIGIPFQKAGGADCTPLYPDDLRFEVSATDSNGTYTATIPEFPRTDNSLSSENVASPSLNAAISPVDGCYAQNFIRTVRVPLSRLCAAGLDVTDVKSISLDFDRLSGGRAYLDGFEFSSNELDPEPGGACATGDGDGDGDGDAGLEGGPCLDVGRLASGGAISCATLPRGVDGCFPDGPGSYGRLGFGSSTFGMSGMYCPGSDLVCGLELVGSSPNERAEPVCVSCPIPGADSGNVPYGCPCITDDDCESTGVSGSVSTDFGGTSVDLECWAGPNDGWPAATGTCLPASSFAGSGPEYEEFLRTRWLCKANCEALTANALSTHLCEFVESLDYTFASCIEESCEGVPGSVCAETGGHCGDNSTCGSECDAADNTASGNDDCRGLGYPPGWSCSRLGSFGRCGPPACASASLAADEVTWCQQFWYGADL